MISNHGAVEPTKMCSVGLMLGLSSRAHRNVHISVIPHDRVSRERANAAPRVIARIVAPDEQAVGSPDDSKLVPLDAGKRLERGPSATVRAMTLCRVQELVRYAIADRSALAASDCSRRSLQI